LPDHGVVQVKGGARLSDLSKCHSVMTTQTSLEPLVAVNNG
jgi:hypothetical protein